MKALLSLEQDIAKLSGRNVHGRRKGDGGSFEQLPPSPFLHAKVGLHNHPEPSYYWNPDTILKAVEGRSKWIGACADTGHWLRSGLNPVECLQKLDGRIVSFHFKDLNKEGKGAHDVPWGTGVADVPALLAEMKRQNIQGPISIEYEHNWLESLPEIGQCVVNFHKMTGEVVK